MAEKTSDADQQSYVWIHGWKVSKESSPLPAPARALEVMGTVEERVRDIQNTVRMLKRAGLL